MSEVFTVAGQLVIGQNVERVRQGQNRMLRFVLRDEELGAVEAHGGLTPGCKIEDDGWGYVVKDIRRDLMSNQMEVTAMYEEDWKKIMSVLDSPPPDWQQKMGKEIMESLAAEAQAKARLPPFHQDRAPRVGDRVVVIDGEQIGSEGLVMGAGQVAGSSVVAQSSPDGQRRIMVTHKWAFLGILLPPAPPKFTSPEEADCWLDQHTELQPGTEVMVDLGHDITPRRAKVLSTVAQAGELMYSVLDYEFMDIKYATHRQVRAL